MIRRATAFLLLVIFSPVVLGNGLTLRFCLCEKAFVFNGKCERAAAKECCSCGKSLENKQPCDECMVTLRIDSESFINLPAPDFEKGNVIPANTVSHALNLENLFPTAKTASSPVPVRPPPPPGPALHLRMSVLLI